MANQPIPSRTQVVIIGAGPTGLSMAAQLLRYGIDFVLLEKNPHTTPLSKAIVIQARSLEIFGELGLAEKAIREGRLAMAFNIFYKGRRRVFADLAGLGAGQSAYPYVLSLEQSKTEKLLVDHLAENGQTVHWQSELVGLEQHPDGVTVHFKDGSGQEHTIEAAYLVGCDGASSPVRHQLGLSFAGDTIPKIFYVTDVTLSSPVINKDQLFGFLAEKGFVLFFPMEGEGHYRVIGIVPHKTEEDFDFGDIESDIKEQVMVSVSFEEVRWFSTYKVHSRMAAAFHRGRSFIAGDAAHIHTPAGGQGMNTGIQDAYNLAWKLAFTLRGQLYASVLDTYNTERTENARRLLHTTDRMFDFLTGSNPFWNFMRLQIFPPVARFVSRSSLLNRRLFPLISQTGIAYPNSALTIKSKVGKVKAGDRMPYFLFSDGRSIYDYLAEPVFKLLYFGEDDRHSPGPLGDVPVPLATFSFGEVPQKVFGAAWGFYVLLRPDNHISYIGRDLNNCRSFLNWIAGVVHRASP